MAAAKGRFENILGYLIGKGADINIKDSDGVNACHYTITNELLLLIKVWVGLFPGRVLFISIYCLKEEFVGFQSVW